MKSTKILINALIATFLFLAHNAATPGRFDDIIVDRSQLEIGEVISVDPQDENLDSATKSVKGVLQAQKEFLDHWSQKELKTNAEILRFKIAFAMVEFQSTQTMIEVDRILGEKAYRAYTEEMENFHNLVKQQVELGRKIEELGSTAKFHRSQKVYKNKLFYSVPLGN